MRLGTQRGFTLIEMLFVIVFIGITMAIAVPRMRRTPQQVVRASALELSRDLEGARSRALATKKQARVVFDVVGGTYTGYLDHDRDGNFTLSQTEMDELRSGGMVTLPNNVKYGRGAAGPVPGTAGSGEITFDPDQVDFTSRGVTEPLGTRGVIYFVHRDHADAVAAVVVSGAGSFKTWVYSAGTWQ